MCTCSAPSCWSAGHACGHVTNGCSRHVGTAEPPMSKSLEGEAPTGPGPTPCLPEPTGPGPVGAASLHLTDTSRPDPWAAGVTARELMVSLWYPAMPSDGPRA